MTRCVREDCDRQRSWKNGLCAMHENRRRKGYPLDAPWRLVGSTLENHFERTTEGCWEWTAYRCPDTGYGRFGSKWAHRLVYEHLVGPIPDGRQLDHLCRNRACVRPDHLEPVTQRVNILRGNSPGAIVARTNICQRGHEFTPENTYVRPDGGGRQCRACIAIRSRRRRPAAEFPQQVAS